jgi:hypothetical protein
MRKVGVELFSRDVRVIYRAATGVKLPGTGVQTWKDTCDPALDHDVPLAGSYAWNVYPLDPYGLRFEFQNSNYNPYGYIANFIFRRIR